MNNEYIFLVTSPTSSVKEYFKSRESAIAFIVDEFAMALCFCTESENERLTEYLMKNDETPNQYPYKYVINKIKLNTEYDEPNYLYLVKVDDVKDGEQYGKCFLFNTKAEADERFRELVDEDTYENYDENTSATELSTHHYLRWKKNALFGTYHYGVDIIKYIDNKEIEEKLT